MSLRLADIRALGSDEYELTLAAGEQAAVRVVCRVFEHHGIPAVRFEPDVFVRGGRVPPMSAR
jgi:hypothetical protein